VEVKGFVAFGHEEVCDFFAGFFGQGDEEDFPVFSDMFVKFFEEMVEERGSFGRRSGKILDFFFGELEVLSELFFVDWH
jgi:hypothetical protein